jgi:AcrR family transcriptional regulator
MDSWTTRDRILYEAALLISSRGFRGATTREIADRVGIRQPSLFNHFPSKQAILTELLFFDLHVPADVADRLATAAGSPAVRLMSYTLWDLSWYQDMPFDLRGLHEDLVAMPGLESFQKDLERWQRAIESLLSQGLKAAEFRADALPFVPAILDTLSWQFARSSHHAQPGQPRLVTQDAACLLMRGLLARPQRASQVLQEARKAVVDV